MFDRQRRTAPTETVCVADAVLVVLLAAPEDELVAAEAEPSKAEASTNMLLANIVNSKISRRDCRCFVGKKVDHSRSRTHNTRRPNPRNQLEFPLCMWAGGKMSTWLGSKEGCPLPKFQGCGLRTAPPRTNSLCSGYSHPSQRA